MDTWQNLVEALILADRRATRPLPVAAERHRQRLLAGEVVTEHHAAGPAVQVAALCLVSAPRDAVWAAVRDDTVVSDPSVDERLLDTTAEGELWYGRLHLPRPLSDRQWVVRCWRNEAVEGYSDGRIREWAWQGVADAAAVAQRFLGSPAVQRAKWIAQQQGAWLVADLGTNATLLAYHALTSIGPQVPGWMVREFIGRQVPPLLRRVAAASAA